MSNKCTPTQLIEAVDQCFNSEGWLVRQGLTFEPEQHRYAIDVARWLQGDTKQIALMEAETGIGKTLGYMIPLMLHLSFTGKRGLVATHTVHLQNQIMQEGDLALAKDYLDDCGYRIASIAQVIGANHYLNPNRLKLLLNNYLTEEKQQPYLQAMESCLAQDGLLETFLSEIEALPEGITEDGIAIKTKDSSEHGNDQFQKDRLSAQDADLIITSHTVAIIDAKYNTMLGRKDGRDIEFMVLDEADGFERAAESFMGKKFWPSRIRRLLSVLEPHLTPKRRSQAYEAINAAKAIEGLICKACPEYHDDKKRSLLLEDGADLTERVHGQREIIVSHASGILGLLKKRAKNLDNDTQMLVEELEHSFAFLKEFNNEDHKYGYLGISRSPIKGISALEVTYPKPAAVINQMVNQEKGVNARLMLTSATLSDGNKGSFKSIQGGLGVRVELFEEGDFYRPEKFGDMRFILTFPQIPAPFAKTLDEQEQIVVALSPSWLAYTASLITVASERGPLLVLTSSYEETMRLGELLTHLPVIVHRPGEALKEKLAQFQEHKGVLLTPAAWEGVSLRDNDGGQLFQNLMITRIPTPPPNPFREKVMIRHWKDWNPKLRDDKLEGWLQAARQNRAIRKFRQGVGRLIRKRTDVGTVWIADPRFPWPISIATNKTWTNLKRAIPERFLESYQRHSQTYWADGSFKTLDEVARGFRQDVTKSEVESV
ncbi:MAG: ATP-dependent DNA helicase [Pseudomonadota bacterium]|nr:ATP-dependent DNA helicase [Pseudomonadota bacterium]